MKRIGTVIVVVIALVFFVMSFGWINVHPTEVAVEINKVAGKVYGMPKGVGYHFFNRWITDMVIYKVSVRSYPPETMKSEESTKYTLELKTKDGQNI